MKTETIYTHSDLHHGKDNLNAKVEPAKYKFQI